MQKLNKEIISKVGNLRKLATCSSLQKNQTNDRYKC